MTQARESNGQFAHPLPGTYKGGDFQVDYGVYSFASDDPATAFVDWMYEAINKQVGHDYDLSAAESIPSIPSDSRHTIIVRGKTFVVTVLNTFHLTAGGRKRYRVRFTVEGSPNNGNGKPQPIVVSYEQWLNLKPYARKIVKVSNGRTGETVRTLIDERIVVQVKGGAIMHLIFTAQELADWNPPVAPKPQRKPKQPTAQVKLDPKSIPDTDLPWDTYPEVETS